MTFRRADCFNRESVMQRGTHRALQSFKPNSYGIKRQQKCIEIKYFTIKARRMEEKKNQQKLKKAGDCILKDPHYQETEELTLKKHP